MISVAARIPVWLVGMMGVGKSAVGPRLARRLERSFVDADAEIEREAAASVAEIFASEGEAGFRRRERALVERLRAGDDVVALGGGAIAQAGMAAVLGESGTVVYLKAQVNTLLQRLGDCVSRPLLHGLAVQERAERLRELLADRDPAYATASIVVATDGLTLDEVVDAILSRLDEKSR